MINTRDHETLQNIIESKIPKVLGFTDTWLLMRETSTDSLYRYFTDTFSKTSGEIIKFSSNFGITGNAMLKRDVIINRDGKENSAYWCDIDNIKCLDFKNSVICPLLITNSDKVLGVLHLYNTKAQITVNELIRIKYVCDIIASCIDNANQFTIVFGTMVELNEAIKKINSIGYEEISKDIVRNVHLKDFYESYKQKRNKQAKQFSEVAMSLAHKNKKLKAADRDIEKIKKMYKR